MIKCAKETPLFDYFKHFIELGYKCYVADYAFNENLKYIGRWVSAYWITEQEEKELHDYNLKFYRKYHAAEN